MDTSERKKHSLSGEWELGQARNYMPFQIKVAVCVSSKKGPSLSSEAHYSLSTAQKGNMI